MGQVAATFSRTIKEFLRERAVLFWTIAWPIIWVLISSFTFTGEVPAIALPYARGSITISMMVFALMMAGMTNLPSSITGDRENGMLAKLMSMPVSPRNDFTGRILALGAFSAMAVGLVIAVGMAAGARFTGTTTQILQAAGFIALIVCASAGVGLLIGTFIRRQQGAIMTGVGISVISASISGMFAPYEFLPPALQRFARIYPISSASNLVRYFIIGEEFADYNPLGTGQVTLTIALSLLLLILGINLYSRLSWRSE
ncbi:MAG: ABC transporter permease [Dehalococcoidales bacterium]|nr:ABC transporter permease [Dehalococcoidales bacterium]